MSSKKQMKPNEFEILRAKGNIIEVKGKDELTRDEAIQRDLKVLREIADAPPDKFTAAELNAMCKATDTLQENLNKQEQELRRQLARLFKRNDGEGVEPSEK